jgi:branched-chain amino acid transport system ATP-binding protein
MSHLQVRGLQAFYGKSQVLRGVDLDIAPGEVLALLGRNGSGRSTTAKAIMCMLEVRGTVVWKGRNWAGCKPFEMAQAGIGYVPENRDVFPGLTVHQNLVLGQKPMDRKPPLAHQQRWTFDDMYGMFPQLAARQHAPAGVLSGGERQMLTLCRTLMGNPELVLFDEPTEGLAPHMVEQVKQCLQHLRERGVSVLLIEQKQTLALALADRCALMGHGRVVFEGTAAALEARADLRREWLEV